MAHKSTLESANEELATLEARWNNGNPAGHGCEQRAALWQRIVEVRAIVYAEIKAQLLTAMGVPANEWNLYEYDPATNDVRYVG
jgi:hypothetical protein